MATKLEIVDDVIQEHQRIGKDFLQVGKSMSDLEAFFALEKAGTVFVTGRIEGLRTKQERLLEVMEDLESGLSAHFEFEEDLLPPIFGELLMKALIVEHRVLKDNIEQARRMLTKGTLDGLSRDELLSKQFQIKQTVERLLQSLEEHLLREDTILNMAKAALEQSPSTR